MTPKYQLHTLKKESLSMSKYVQKKKSIADNLAAVAQPVSDSDLASSLLNCLGSEYEAFITSMTTRMEPIPLDDLTGFLLSQEARLEETSISADVPTANVVTHSTGNNRGRRRSSSGNNRGPSRGRGRNAYDYNINSGHHNSSRLICQVCNKPGHSPTYCYHRYDPDYQGESLTPAAMTAGSSVGPNGAWYSDSGVTHHLIADMANLSTHSEYHGPDQVHVGNGNALPITHVGSSVLRTPSNCWIPEQIHKFRLEKTYN